MKNLFKRRAVLKGLVGGLAAATTVTASVAMKATPQPDIEIMALWDEFKAIYSVAARHSVIVENNVVVKRLDRTARDIWKQVEKMEPQTPLGSAAKIAISVLAVPLHAVADEWIVGDDMTEALGYYSPFHGPARELAKVTGLNLDGLKTPTHWKTKKTIEYKVPNIRATYTDKKEFQS